MERISSRKNSLIVHIRKLSSDSAYRRECGEYLCDGEKLLREALAANAEITSVFWDEGFSGKAEIPGARCFELGEGLLEYASPLRNSPGPLFTVRMRSLSASQTGKAIVLESVQDPGNVGTVIRTAAAFGIDRVLLCPGCADVYNPKAVRATMGAVFRQCVEYIELSELKNLGVPLYGAALSDDALDVREAKLSDSACAVAIGSEGRGLSKELLDMCDGRVIIPMSPGSESLNAAVAAAIIMWEMRREN